MPVASCTRRQCNLFVTEGDDATARVEKSSDIPPVPRTPTGKQNSGMPQALPTPETGRSYATRLFTTNPSRGGNLQRPDGSPTPHRFRADENGDLFSRIFGLLQKYGIALKSSTEAEMRHMIGEWRAGYETQIQNSAESLQRTFKRLDELDGGAGTSTS